MITSYQNIELNRPMSLSFDGWNINYLYVPSSDPMGNHLPPMMILGGAFQNFSSFKKDIEKFSKNRPVLIVDLPGQGSNLQLAPELSFEDYAHLLNELLCYLQIESVIPMAFSYGSAIGYFFGLYYPKKCHKLILAGTTNELRSSVKVLLKESLWELERGNIELFAKGVVLNLLNYPKRRQVRAANFISKAIFQNMVGLKARDLQRYIDNTSRIIYKSKLPDLAPQVETLVAAGEFDNFTTPEECFGVAKKIHGSQFAIIQGADHLAPYERKGTVNELYENFINGDSITGIKKVMTFNHHDIIPTTAIDQYRPNNFCHLRTLSERLKATLTKVTPYGCHLKLKNTAARISDKFSLELPDSLHLETLVVERRGKHLEGAFKVADFSTVNTIEAYLNQIKDSRSNLEKVAFSKIKNYFFKK